MLWVGVLLRNRKYLVFGAVTTLLCSHLLLTSFRRGWTQMATDFPNYYTAAVLTLRHEPLRQFYDWTWFQRQINYAGIEHQLGGYTPHTPLTMLPLVPLAGFEPQRAKQIWLILELLFLAASVLLLSRLTGFHFTETLLVALLAHGALSANFVLGQYYVLLLFLLTLSAWCIVRSRFFSGGALLGVIFAVKLYTAPFLLYFAARRQWKAFWGMLASIAVLFSAAIAIFRFDGVWFFVTTVLLRGLDGSVNDPYNPGWGSMTAFLRHTFVPEAELNPHPLIAAPPLFFFLRTFYTLSVLGLSLLLLSRKPWGEARSFAWFVIVLFALSPDTASYHFILLFVPVVLLLRGASPVWAAGLLAFYGLLAIPLHPSYAWLFPKAWLLAALLVYTGWEQFRSVPRKYAAAVVGLVLVASSMDAWWRSTLYSRESPRTAAHAVVDPGSSFSSSPAPGAGELVYETMAGGHYALRLLDGGKVRTSAFDGETLRPSIAQTTGQVYFEMVARRRSRICVLDPAGDGVQTVVGPELNPTEPAVSEDGFRLAFVSSGSLYVQDGGKVSLVVRSHDISGPAFFPHGRRIAFAEGPTGRRSIYAVSLAGGPVESLTHGGDSFAPAVSPDGALLAYTVSGIGERQVWVRDLVSDTHWPVTSGACSNDSPAWDRDGRSLVFASDCDRGLGLPALYRIKVR